MYTSTLNLDGHEFKGTMDIYSLKKIQEDLLNEGEQTSITNIFIKISEFNMLYISSFVLNTLARIDKSQSNKFLEIYLKDTGDLEALNRFNICFGNICSTHSPISIIPTAYTILIFIVLIILSLFLAP